MSPRPSVAVLGVGAIGQALVTGLMGAGWLPEQLALCVRRPGRVEELASLTGSLVTLDPIETVDGKEVIVVAVKPRDVPGLLEALAGNVSGDQLVISVAAGVPTTSFEAVLEGVPVVRAMPNIPVLVGQAVTAMAPGRHTHPVHLDKARTVLGAVGAVQLLDEGLLDAVTAVSGTGPAYVFLLAEALTEAAIREGLPRDVAEAFVSQTIRGAGHLLTDTTLGPFELRAQVTSPGGTTAAAMHVLEERGFRALVEDAVRAAAQRARELGAG
ncbi:MAG TPA: pyrroline-5-carboxylate reductase [Acidimicrobiia bacterium]|nr:pyrroline-5-carboxylate reductase [Acidimicrobiia bacterium]